MSVTVYPATSDRWDDLEALFESASATRNCWCMWWRIAGNAWREIDKAGRKTAFRNLVDQHPAPGVLAYLDGRAVGWAQATPRRAVPRFNNGRTSKPEQGADLDKIWTLSCFFIRSEARKQGLMEELARGACAHAVAHGAVSVEASAFRPTRPLERSEGYVGLIGPLNRAGFIEIAERGTHRTLMRWTPAPDG
ncbi:MAG: GNAT family N-acetyltransferase [Pseudomonadota bacterium]